MKLKSYIYSFIASVVMLLSACSPDDHSLGAVDVTPDDLVEGIAFKIEHDAANPNIIHLTSLMGSGYTPLWNHPQGRSQRQEVSLKIPFAGTYEVTFGVETRSGIVYGEPVTFTVEDMYAGFIEDELWTLLSGGVDNEKTWYLDLDKDGVTRYFPGPLYFYGTDDNWETVTNGATPPEGSDSWNWCPDWAGNQWIMPATDYGSMTFNLKDGANVIIDHKTIPALGTQNGLFMIDTEAHTLKLTNASLSHDSGRDAIVTEWGNITILSLTENTMQLGVIRDNDPNEDPCLLVYNFISEEYRDNWMPGEVLEPEPALPDGWQEDVSQTTTTSIRWILSPDAPFDWANLDGSLMNGWNSISDYPDWTGMTPSVPATYAKFSLTINSKDNTVEYIAPNGVSSTGTYTLDEKGYYTFNGISPNFNICGGSDLKLSPEKQWRITSIEKDEADRVVGMWVGIRDAVKSEYFVYHLIPRSEG